MAKIEPITGKYIWVPFDGEEYRIFFEEAGEGIPMVCLHTAGTDSREWRHQLCDPAINKNFRVIAIDIPRHGKSIPPYDYYKEDEEYKLTAKFYSGIVMAFCKELGLEKPVIMGSSMGGNICLHIAENYSDQVSSLIAIEACEYSPGWHIDYLRHSHIHGGETAATSVFGLMALKAQINTDGKLGGITRKAALEFSKVIYIFIVKIMTLGGKQKNYREMCPFTT